MAFFSNEFYFKPVDHSISVLNSEQDSSVILNLTVDIPNKNEYLFHELSLADLASAASKDSSGDEEALARDFFLVSEELYFGRRSSGVRQHKHHLPTAVVVLYFSF